MPTEIHPTAIVADGADIGPDCRIGPYCVIGPHVSLGGAAYLHSHVVVDGHTTLGENCEVFPFACLGKQTQDLKYTGGAARVEIGSHNTFREYVTVNAATADGGVTVIGDHCHILAYCHIAHECRLGSHVIMSNCTQLAGHVTVEDGVVFGGLGGVHQFVRIGAMTMVGATCKVVQDIVPFSLVDGNPGTPAGVNKIGMQRHGMSPGTIAAVGRAHKALFRSGLTLEDALEKLRKEQAKVPEIQQIVDFACQAERGLARPKRTRR